MKKYYLVLGLALVVFLGSFQVSCAQRATTTPEQQVVFEKTLRTYEEENFYRTLWDYPFKIPTWLSDDSLVVTGYCDGVNGHRGGLYLFSETGTYQGSGNTCVDTSDLRLACAEGGGCQMGLGIADRGDGTFVREGQMAQNVRRAPVLYRATNDGPSFLDRLFFTRRNSDPWTPSGDLGEWEDWAGYYYPVITDDDILVVQKSGDINAQNVNPSYNRIVAYSLPQFNDLWEEAAQGVLVGGGGNVIFIAKNTFQPSRSSTLIAYEVTEDGMEERGRQTISSGTVSNLNYQVHNVKKDALDPTVFAVSIFRGTGNAVIRFRLSAEGMTKIDERTFPVPVGIDYSLAGDHIAFAPGVTPPRVWKGTQELSIAHPQDMYEDPGSGFPPRWNGVTSGVAINGDGKLAVTTGNRVLLYDIEGAATSSTAPPPETATTTPGDFLAVDVDTFISIASSYLNVLYSFLSNTSPSENSTLPTRTGATTTNNNPSFEDIYDQTLESLRNH